MRRLKKNIFYGLCGSVVATLAVVKAVAPEVAEPVQKSESVEENTDSVRVVPTDSVKKTEVVKPGQ